MNSTFHVQSKQTKDPSLRRETCIKFGIMWQLVKAEFTITYYLSINVSSKKVKTVKCYHHALLPSQASC